MQELLAAARSMFSPPAAVLHGLPLPGGAVGSSQRRQPFSLMPLGDSITDGGTKLRSYRFHLHQSLARSGYEVEWLGSMLGVHDKLPDANTTTGRPVLDDREWPLAKQRHEGHWGWTAEQVLQGHKRQPQRGQLSKWLHPGKGLARAPQVVMLHLGTNDLTKHVVKKNGSVVVVARRIRGVMRRVCRANPRVLLLLASPIPYCRFPREDAVSLEHRRAVERDFGMHLTPCTPPPTGYTLTAGSVRLPLPGARLQALCTKKLLGCAHARVALVNMTSAVSCSMLVDGVHPSAAGAHAMALAWHRALVGATRDRGIAPLMARGLSLSGRAAVKRSPRSRAAGAAAAASRSVPVEGVD